MTSEKSREYWFCEWCKKLSRSNSENGYCQKCFESKLMPLIEKSHADLLERKLKRAMDGLKDAGKTICGEFCGSTKCHPCCNEVTNALKEIEEMK